MDSWSKIRGNPAHMCFQCFFQRKMCKKKSMPTSVLLDQIAGNVPILYGTFSPIINLLFNINHPLLPDLVSVT